MNVGDVVVLKSGGPPMTIRRIQTVFQRKSIWCTWFAKDRKFEAAFGPEELERAAFKTDNGSN